MERSTRALLEHLVDYAGLFPPARLAMKDAAHGYAEHRRCEQSWMLSRFICPASRLSELAEHIDVLAPDGDSPIPLSLLGRGGDDAEAFLAGLADDFGAAQAFIEQAGDRVQV